MKLLWLTPVYPYPPFSGGQTRSFNLIKNLAKKNEITLFSFWRPNRLQGPKEKMSQYCQEIKIFPGRPIWTMRNFLSTAFSRRPFTISHFYGDQNVSEALKQAINHGKYDLVHFESFYTSPYLEAVSNIPTVLGNENVEYRVYQRFANQKGWPVNWLLQFEVAKMKRFEETVWRHADLNLAVSGVDAQKISRVTGKKCPIIPNGVDFDAFQRFRPGKRREKDPFTLLFVGDFKYFTNQDAIKFLVTKIWPQVVTRYPQAVLKLVGRNPNEWITNLASPKITVDTGVEDIRRAYASADFFVAPMRIASGTNIKILEAMAAGLPVVTTSVGIEGIRAKSDRDVLVADHPGRFAFLIIDLLKNNAKRKKFAEAGKKIVEQYYNWPQITGELEKAYEGLIRRHS